MQAKLPHLMCGLLCIAPTVVVILALLPLAHAESVGPTLTFEKATFKVTYVQHDEKIQRLRLVADKENVKQIGIERFTVSTGDSIGAQASVVNQADEAVSISQLFLRFLNKQTMEDNIYVLRKKGRDMKLDLSLSKEVRKDLAFWQHNSSYRVEMIYGDVKLAESGIWLVTDNMTFSVSSAETFKEKERGVFDFDVGAKWSVGPEFEAPLTDQEKRAPTAIVLAALIGVIGPFFVLMGVWKKMGALDICVPEKGRGAAIGLEMCVVGHAIVLGMFWWQWNIITTWKVMGVLMIPTFAFAHSFLQAESQQ